MIGCEWAWLSASAALVGGGFLVRPCLRCAVVLDEVETYPGVDQLPAAWDRVVGESNLFLSCDYLRALETHGPERLQLGYALAYHEGRPVAAVAVQVFDVDNELLALRERTEYNRSQRILGGVLERAGTWLRNQGLGLAGRRVMVCGNLFSCGLDGVAWSDELPETDRWPLALELIAQLQRKHDASYVVIKDLPATQTPHRLVLHEAGFHRLKVEPSMDLHAPPAWNSRADYLDALNTKYRKAALRADEALTKAGYTLEALTDLAPELERMHALYLQVEQRAQMRYGTIGPGYLEALARLLGPDAWRCSVIRRGDALAGFSFVVKQGDTALAHLVGFDYAANAEAPVYLRLLHSVIDDGLALGCSTLHYGRTALEPKARLGAIPTETEIWIKHSHPLANQIVGPLVRLAPQDTAPQREPFRRGA